MGRRRRTGSIPYVDGRGVAASGYEIAWDSEPKVEEAETPKVVIKLIRELTLDQMGKEINAAIQTLTLAQRKAIKEWLLSELRKPVGLRGAEEAHE